MASWGLFRRARVPGDLVNDNSDEPRIDAATATQLLGATPSRERVESVAAYLRPGERRRFLRSVNGTAQ